jgi:hypothetical protein
MENKGTKRWKIRVPKQRIAAQVRVRREWSDGALAAADKARRLRRVVRSRVVARAGASDDGHSARDPTPGRSAPRTLRPRTLRRDSPTSAPGLVHICAGTRPHLRRDSSTSAPGLAHSCAGTARAETETEPAKLGDDALMQRAVSESEEGYENQKKGLTIATGVPRTAVSKERSRR